MAIFEIGLRTTGVGIATAGLEIRASASRMVRLHELHILMAAATATVFGIGRPANTPTGGTANAPLAIDTDDVVAFGGVIALAGWTLAPTAPAAFYRRIALPATVGSEHLYRPSRAIEIPAAGSLVLWNITANGVADVNLVIEDVGI